MLGQTVRVFSVLVNKSKSSFSNRIKRKSNSFLHSAHVYSVWDWRPCSGSVSAISGDKIRRHGCKCASLSLALYPEGPRQMAQGTHMGRKPDLDRVLGHGVSSSDGFGGSRLKLKFMIFTNKNVIHYHFNAWPSVLPAFCVTEGLRRQTPNRKTCDDLVSMNPHLNQRDIWILLRPDEISRGKSKIWSDFKRLISLQVASKDVQKVRRISSFRATDVAVKSFAVLLSLQCLCFACVSSNSDSLGTVKDTKVGTIWSWWKSMLF